MRSVLIVSVLTMCVLTRCVRIVSIEIVSVLIIRSRIVSMRRGVGWPRVGPWLGVKWYGGPADKFFSRKFPAAPNLALAPNDPKFAGAVHTDGNRLSSRVCSATSP